MMTNLISQLKAIAKGEGVPNGRVRCAACGFVYRKEHVATAGMSTSVALDRRRQPRVNFLILGCVKCGHIMHGDGRDLTRAEAAELAASPDFARIREVTDEHLTGIGKWG